MAILPLYLLAALFLGFAVGFAVAHLRAAARLERSRTDHVRLQTQLETLQSARQDLADRFQILADQILDAHSKNFADQNRQALSAILSPLGEKIADFRQKVEDAHLADSRQRGELKGQVELLARQSADLGQKADHLASALKGDNKILGNWGELALERLLDAAGLQKGRDFELQVSVPDPDGGRAQPDALVLLPENRCILVDAKTSLKDYADFANAPSPDLRAAALKAHVASLENHVKGLSARRYPDLPAFHNRSPDFVVMFVPSEPALAAALADKPALLEAAARANVVLAGPGGLLAALRLAAQLWRQENQRRSIDDVFDSVRKIYEKYVGFADDMAQIDSAIRKAQAAYDSALKKLSTGDGNLVRQMDKFVKSNVIKPKKLPPQPFLPSGEDTP